MVEKNKGARLQFVSLESMTNVGRYKCPNCGKIYLIDVHHGAYKDKEYYCDSCSQFGKDKK